MGVQQCKCLAVRAYLFFLLCVRFGFWGGGEGEEKGKGRRMLGTNGHVLESARVCASGFVMGGKKTVVSGSMCTCLCACMCSAYVCYMYVVLLLVWG